MDGDFGVFEAYRHAGKVLFGEADHSFVNVAEDGRFDGLVFYDFTEDTAVAAADDEDFLWVGVGIHGEVADHFLVAVEGIESET